MWAGVCSGPPLNVSLRSGGVALPSDALRVSASLLMYPYG